MNNMSWMCVRCSERHGGSFGDMGYGLCKECDTIIKVAKAEKKEKEMKARKKAYSKRNKKK